ncbi:MAG TPA: hypothetical protein VF974_04710 [Patescibacteria group bacterium]
MIEKIKVHGELKLWEHAVTDKLNEIIDFVNDMELIDVVNDMHKKQSDMFTDISNLAEDLKELEAFVTPLAYKPYCCNNCKEYIKDIPICGNVNCSCHKHLI